MNKEKFRRLLEEERKSLREVMNTLEIDRLEVGQRESTQELSSVDQHPGDLGTETFEREKSESIRIATEAQLRDVERALDRLESDEYGVCEICGRPISEERLEARPSARYCVDDQSRVEAGRAGLR